jgi:uncharacterized membrane protein
VSKSRVEAFSHGIFAIAITLLVVAQPSNHRKLISSGTGGPRWLPTS